uniref:Uncharacterized protein n=1 Tax=Glossina austeni TaxID=7395 RepID=A0A1A9V8F8_GLOAU
MIAPCSAQATGSALSQWNDSILLCPGSKLCNRTPRLNASSPLGKCKVANQVGDGDLAIMSASCASVNASVGSIFDTSPTKSSGSFSVRLSIVGESFPFDTTKSTIVVSDVGTEVPFIRIRPPSDEFLNKAYSRGSSGSNEIIVGYYASSGSVAKRGAKFTKQIATKNNTLAAGYSAGKAVSSLHALVIGSISKALAEMITFMVICNGWNEILLVQFRILIILLVIDQIVTSAFPENNPSNTK